MSLRERNGTWHYLFMVAGRSYSGSTGLVATERNRTAAARVEAEAHRQVSEGKAHLLRIDPIRFSEAAEKFLVWVNSEYREHRNSALRIRTSFASLILFFGREMVAAITPGAIEDYKARRRICPDCEGKQPKMAVCKTCRGTGKGVREVTLRHDLHALSKFYQYAKKHNWVRDNPVREVEIPSDDDAVRMRVLNPNEETVYFVTCEKKMAEVAAKRNPRPGGRQGYNGYQDLRDVGRLMILQGCRPEELLGLEQQDIDLQQQTLRIVKGKSKAARRTLRLRAESVEILKRRLAVGGRWVFPSPRNHGMHITKLNALHNEVLKECGLDFVPYDLRHTFASRVAGAGKPLATLARILGHANLRSVMKYVHPSQPEMDRVMDELDSEIDRQNSVKVPPVETAKNRESQVSSGKAPLEGLNGSAIN